MDLAVYMAFHKERYDPPPFDYIIPIKVGAWKVKINDYDITDDSGDNISYKNDHYSELTALYWIWKNCTAEYVGLCHYRRFFRVEYEDIISILQKGFIILPKKMVLPCSVKDQYIKSHSIDEWNVMMDTIEKCFPNYYNTSLEVFSKNKLYPYNMIICSRSFLNEYCEWLFSILFEVEKNVDVSRRDSYQKRYLGFLAERLLTLFVVHNASKVKEIIVFDDKQKILDEHKMRWEIINTARYQIRRFINRRILGGKK